VAEEAPDVPRMVMLPGGPKEFIAKAFERDEVMSQDAFEELQVSGAPCPCRFSSFFDTKHTSMFS